MQYYLEYNITYEGVPNKKSPKQITLSINAVFSELLRILNNRPKADTHLHRDAEVMNVWSCISILSYTLHVVHREIFTFSFYLIIFLNWLGCITHYYRISDVPL